jgi:hypothetical protein
MVAIPTRIFETPTEAAARRLRVDQVMRDGLHAMFEERRACFDLRMFYAYGGVGEFIAGHINYLGGMAGEW